MSSPAPVNRTIERATCANTKPLRVFPSFLPKVVRRPAFKLAKMKNTAFLINTSRGAIVNEDALYEALKEGRIAGAALDATVNEPINPDNPLLELDNLIITNHIGYYSEGCLEEVRTKAAEEVCRVLSGKEPHAIAFVNPQVKQRNRL